MCERGAVMKRTVITECVLTAAIYLVAVFLHFFHSLSGGVVLSALVGAVNESVWEHLKIFAVSYILFAVVEYLILTPPLRAFLVAKTLGVYSLLIFMSVFFYVYTFILGASYFIADVVSSFVFTALSQYISYVLMTRWEKARDYFYVCLFLLLLLFSAVLCLSYYPPKLPLFRDPVTGLYGVRPENFDEGALILDYAFGEKPKIHR